MNIRCGPSLPPPGPIVAIRQPPFVTFYNRMAKGPAPNYSTYVFFGSQGIRC